MHTFPSITRIRAILAALILLAVGPARADDATGTQKLPTEPELIRVLQSDAPAAAKALACKQLSICGTQDSVPALAPLLSDEQLASWARIALEVIPGPAADEALRKATSTLRGRLLVGTINSLGVRRDAGSVEPLIALLQSPDAEVASASAVALGHVGNAPAAQALRKALAGAPASVRSALAEGCLLCAERRLAEGHADEATEIYDELRKADLPKQKKLEATRGAILARGTAGIPLLVEQLRSPDKSFFQIGLSTARELPGPEVAQALAADFVGATPDRAALLLLTLADRHDTAALPAVLQAAASGPKPVRLAAIGVLPQLGDESCLDTLLQIAIADDVELAAAAKTALAGLPGKKVDASVTARLAEAQGKLLPVLIELVGLRRIEAREYLLSATGHPQADVRSAAWTALGATVSLPELSMLLTEFMTPKHPEDAAAVQKALRAACIRMPEREECAGQLAAAMAGTPVATQCTLLEILGAMGGQKALQTLGAAAKGADAQQVDAATRVLGEWMNLEAAPVLLDLAKTIQEDKYKVRALRGYIRLARQFATQDRQRIEMCNKAFEAAGRTAEKKLVLDIIERSSSIGALRLAVKIAEVPELKPDGARVAVAIFQKLGDKSAEARALVAKVQPAQ